MRSRTEFTKPAEYQRLLSVETDAKTVKGSKKGYLTGILYLAPADTSGVVNTCPKATAGCKAACLFTAGRAGIFPRINLARIRKTRFMVANPEAFKASLAHDIAKLRQQAKRRGLKPAVRVNGTSDLPKLAREMASMFPDMKFYDYTKIPRAWTRTLPNYSLTFSHAENNNSDCLAALGNGINVSVVFATKQLPATWNGYRVISGDETDLRFTDPKGVVVGLYAKGKAKQDCSGFVVRDLVQIEGKR